MGQGYGDIRRVSGARGAGGQPARRVTWIRPVTLLPRATALAALLLLAGCAPTLKGDAPAEDSGGEATPAADRDGDGVLNEQDCAPDDPAVYPGAPEACDEEDNDCDSEIDEIGPGNPDADGDGRGACADCDDAAPGVAPGEPERCDGQDNDCDGEVDEDWDADGDGWAPCVGDCADDDPAVHPAADEVCDGEDHDCDGDRDEGWDADGDGFASCRGDCDDADAAESPW